MTKSNKSVKRTVLTTEHPQTCDCLIPDSLIRRSDAILVLTSGLKREVAAGKGLGPVACAPAVSAACSA